MAKTGRKSKGDRDAMHVRPPRALGEAVRKAAADSGLSISDFVSNALADHLGMPEHRQEPSAGPQSERLDVSA